jgi:Galactose oxidase, central domain
MRQVRQVRVLVFFIISAGGIAQSPIWKEAKPARSFSACEWPGMVYDIARQRAVLFGGGYGRALLRQHWEWDGTSWTRVKPATTPSARWTHAMAYDLVRQRTVLFGGRLPDTATNPFRIVSDTWEYDGKNWTQVNPRSSPPARQGVMVYDLGRQRVVLFGGRGAAGLRLDDTWEYDGKDWTRVRTANVPPARAYHGMAYDISRARTVVFGGRGRGGGADTWEYDGKDWIQVKTAVSPPARFLVRMCYDPARRRTVLFGGMELSSSRNTFNDTWEYDGKNWSINRGSIAPSRRAGSGMAYDSFRRRVVVAGGNRGINSYPTADTWEYGGVEVLSATPSTVSIANGGKQRLDLDVGVGGRGKSYWVIGSMTGTVPGVNLSGVHIPINHDPYTVLAITHTNGREFTGFRGALSARGLATATLNIPAKLAIPPGFRLYHACIVYDGSTGKILGASNPVSLELR